MNKLDADAIRQSLGELVSSRLAGLEAFPEIGSTNSYLMQQAAPAPGQVHVVVTDNQTQGRGRHGRTWQSPPGSGLCLSLAYTFEQQPANLSALTLALGLGVIDALESLGVIGVQLKWPNDLVAADGKLGGILTETQARRSGEISVVTGVGLNVDLGGGLDGGGETDWARRVSDLAGFVGDVPHRDELAVRLIDCLGGTFLEYETGGFGRFIHKWPGRDWLLGREVTIDTPQRQITGVGAGVADDGALLVDTGAGACSRITSGSVVIAGARGAVE
jgi:BirA family biotin operon repressor/biotin-[acetyl-CoA-carboxylase] ligase